jgi:hypothetical protein
VGAIAKSHLANRSHLTFLTASAFPHSRHFEF